MARMYRNTILVHPYCRQFLKLKCILAVLALSTANWTGYLLLSLLSNDTSDMFKIDKNLQMNFVH